METAKKIEFLYNAILDTQSTIRAIDIKMGFLFVIIFLPITNLNNIFSIYHKLSIDTCAYKYLMILTAIIWMVSIIILFKTIASISNPKNHIQGTLPTGIFYNGSLFDLTLIDTICNTLKKSNKTHQEIYDQLPHTEEEILKELTYEKMKLSYIRDIKIQRSSHCIKLVFLWVLLGTSLWSISIFENQL